MHIGSTLFSARRTCGRPTGLILVCRHRAAVLRQSLSGTPPSVGDSTYIDCSTEVYRRRSTRFISLLLHHHYHIVSSHTLHFTMSMQRSNVAPSNEPIASQLQSRNGALAGGFNVGVAQTSLSTNDSVATVHNASKLVLDSTNHDESLDHLGPNHNSSIVQETTRYNLHPFIMDTVYDNTRHHTTSTVDHSYCLETSVHSDVPTSIIEGRESVPNVTMAIDKSTSINDQSSNGADPANVWPQLSRPPSQDGTILSCDGPSPTHPSAATTATQVAPAGSGHSQLVEIRLQPNSLCIRVTP